MIKLSPNFSLEELLHSDTAKKLQIDNTPDSLVIANLKLLCTELLEPIRSLFNSPIKISSGYRCLKLNQAIGSKSNSDHVIGCAVDMTIDGVTLKDAVNMIRLSGLAFRQLILEYDQWIHISYKLTDNKREVLKAIRDEAGRVNGYKKY